MYPFIQPPARTGSAEQMAAESYVDRVVGSELAAGSVVRRTMKDYTGSKFQIKSAKASAATQLMEIRQLRHQLKALPDDLRDFARTNHAHEIVVKCREMQSFQCAMICKIHKAVKRQIINSGMDPEAFRVGGNDRRPYEKFYRVEPSIRMSKPQFLTAMRQSFGDEMLKVEGSLNKLHDSFDLERTGQADWRAFMYLLLMLMQSDMSYTEHLRWAFCLYSSQGTFDLNNTTSKISLGTVKQMLCVPIMESRRSKFCDMIDVAWGKLSIIDFETHRAVKRAMCDIYGVELTEGTGGRNGGLNAVMVDYHLFEKLVGHEKSDLYPYTLIARYGWTYIIEEEFYDRTLLLYLREVRKDSRIGKKVADFIASGNHRKKQNCYQYWGAFVWRRNKARSLLVSMSMRWKFLNAGDAFSRWRKAAIRGTYVLLLQRWVRGFIGRRRRDFIVRLMKKTVAIQSGVRGFQAKTRVKQLSMRRHWAAVLIQKYYRGRISRIRVSDAIESTFDHGTRQLQAEIAQYTKYRKEKGCVRIVMCYRKHRLYRRIKARQIMKERVAYLAIQMDGAAKIANIKKLVYRQQLEVWFAERKSTYLSNTLAESQTAEERSKVLSLSRSRRAETQKQIAARFALELAEREEEEQTAAFVAHWDALKEERAAKKGEACRSILRMDPYLLSKAEKEEKKRLLARINTHIKVVLRKADDKRIPMEIPEAREIALDEVIDAEIESERERVKAEQRAEAYRLEREKAESLRIIAEQAKRDIGRKRGYSAKVIQVAYKLYKARQILRTKAYRYYRKHWDGASMEYYYEDKRNRRTFWDKPMSLGSYDVSCADGWATMSDRDGDIYFYNPQTWAMTWDQPPRTTMCQVCARDFACSRLNEDKICRCENCFNARALEMLRECIPANEIKFKLFYGNRQADVLFGLLDEKNWEEHSSNKSEQMESLEEEQKRELMEAELAKKGQEQGQKIVVKRTIKFCEECTSVVAKVICNVCIVNYCEKCFGDKHVGVPWNLHTFSDIDTANNTPRNNSKKSENSESSGKGGNGSTEKKKKKKKKEKKENGGEQEASGEESETNKKEEEERLKDKAEKLAEKLERKQRRKEIRMRKAAKRALLESADDFPPPPGVLPPIGPEGDEGVLPQTGSDGTVGDEGVLPPIGPEGILPPKGDDTDLGVGILPEIGPEGNLPQIGPKKGLPNPL